MSREEEIAAETERLEATLPRITVAGRTFWVAQGDLRLDAFGVRELAIDRVDARALPAQVPLPKGLTGNRTPEGRMRRWAPGTVLTYTVHRASFDTTADYAEVVGAVAAAAAEWSEVVGLRFVHRAELDPDSVLPPEVVFAVQQRLLPGYVALAFFPGDDPLSRVLFVDPSWFGTTYDKVGVMRHELGHVLGFRHEQLREAPVECRFGEPVGDLTPLTRYDPRSCMHYPCGALGTTTFALTDLDRVGARQVYVDPDPAVAFEDVDPASDVVPVVGPSAAGALGEWTFTTELLPGVPMLDTRGTGLPRDQRPRIGWFVRVAEVAIGLGVNRLAGLGGAGLVDAGHLGVGPVGLPAERDAIEAFVAEHGHKAVEELEAFADVGAGLALPGFEVIRTALALARKGLTDPLAILRQVVRAADPAPAKAASVADYQGLFRTIDVPAAVATFPLPDPVFAALRVAGFTPMVIRKLDAAPFPVDEQALADGRLYVCAYRDVAFPPLAASSVPHGPKFGFGPTLVLERPGDSGGLRPVAIRLNPGAPGVVRPGDPHWEWAKLVVQAADANRHELVDHLAHTHLLVEAIAVATRRCLPADHPVARLLWPHLEGTLSINDVAVSGLLGEGAPVDRALAGTIASAKQVAAKARLTRRFETYAPPDELAVRQVLDPALDFPYRDDAGLVWDAISAFATAYVEALEVAIDPALRRWQEEIADPARGAVAGFAFGTRAELAKTLATIVFVASAQHAAVNFPQRGLMTYTPAVPGALYARSPTADLVASLPPLETARLQMEFLSLLGGVQHTRLGEYAPDALADEARVAAGTFRDALARVEITIATRNAGRLVPYPWLQPSRIPQSINV